MMEQSGKHIKKKKKKKSGQERSFGSREVRRKQLSDRILA